MTKYAVEIAEILVKTVIVEAENKDSAEEIVLDAYNNDRLVIDGSCYDSTEIYVEDYNEYSHCGYDILEA